LDQIVCRRGRLTLILIQTCGRVYPSTVRFNCPQAA
jgi:hypothetical protein